MNIGIVTTWFPAGAGYVSKAYRDVLEKEHKVLIYARGGKIMKGDTLWDDEKITWAPVYANGINTKHLLKWAKINKIDILFFNEQRYWKPVFAAKKSGICIGCYIDYYTQLSVKAFGIYDFLVCNTQRHYKVFNWHPQCFYIPWGTNIERFKPKYEQKSKKLTFIMNLGWGGTYDVDRKGFLLAIDAFKKVRGDCKLLIYSQVELTKCLDIWKESVENDKRIDFISGTFDPFPYPNGDVYVYPSRLDGIGLSLPEALSCGLPAITTDCAPMNEFVQSEINGQLVKVEKYLGRNDGYYWAESICNVDSLSEAMQMYLNDENLVYEQKRNARSNAEKSLNWVNNSKDLSNIFSNSIKNKNIYNDDLNQYAKLWLDQLTSPSLKYRFMKLVRDFIKNLIKL